jgi:quercetin dioxygenase-like cupin family protein
VEADVMLSNFRRRGFLALLAGFARMALGQSRSTDAGKSTVIDTQKLPWSRQRNEKTHKDFFVKNLVRDKDTGMEVLLVRYPAGVVTPLHTHPCAHGMYVLDGTLTTHMGRYGPGNFVWFPEGAHIEHGSTSETDVTVLFVTNKQFGINYL